MTLVSLASLAIALFLLTVYSIVQTNAGVFGLEGSPFLKLQLLDTTTGASLFVTVIGALLLRHQFALSMIPRINYRSAISERASKQNPAEQFETWRVIIYNTGLGSAIINHVEYLLDPTDHKHWNSAYTIDNVVKQLAVIGLVAEQDYWMQNMSSGFSLSAKDEFFVFEIRTKHLEKIKRFEMTLCFQSQLGDKYRRKISLMPRSQDSLSSNLSKLD